jgi:biopolymer transport protein ExbD
MKRSLLIILFIYIISLSSAAALDKPVSTPNDYSNKIHRDADRILQQPEYRWRDEKPSAIEKAGKWIAHEFIIFLHFLNRLFPHKQLSSIGGTPVLDIILIVLFMAMMAWILAVIIRGINSNLAKKSFREKKKVFEEEIEEEKVVFSSSDDLIEMMKQFMDSGEYRKAYRAVFLAALVLLDHYGLIHYDKSRTNGEYLRTLESHPEHQELLRPMVQSFDIHWYGALPIQEDDCRLFLDIFQNIERHVTS